MNRTLLVLSASMLLAACATSGNQGSPSGTAPDQIAQTSSDDAGRRTAAKADKNDLVCDSQRSSGSRHLVRSCQTRENAELRQREGQRVTEEAQRAPKFNLD